jgi:large subunit ribosomal protein L17
MRHRVHGRKLGRTSAHRKALFRNQLTALFTHERIITTVAKAKALRPQAERMVTLARTGTLANRRRILQSVQDKEIVGRLFEEIAPRFADRPGGYTRIMRLGRRRGDGAELAIIEFVDYEPKAAGETVSKRKESLMDRAKGMFGGGRGADDEVSEVEEAGMVEDSEEVEGTVATAVAGAAAAEELAETVEDLAEEAAGEAEAVEEIAGDTVAEAEAVEEELAEAADEAAAEDAAEDEATEEKKDD